MRRAGCARAAHAAAGGDAATRGTVAEATRISGAPPDRVQAHVRSHAPTGFCGVDEVALGPAPRPRRHRLGGETAELSPPRLSRLRPGWHAAGQSAAAPKEILTALWPARRLGEDGERATDRGAQSSGHGAGASLRLRRARQEWETADLH